MGQGGRLDDVSAKLARAAKHQAEWEKVFQAWLDRRPIGLQGVAHADGWFRVLLREREPPPTELALIFADYVHNLRAVLDHLVWGVIASTGRKPSRKTTFPVVDKADDWPKAQQRCLNGFPKAWVDIVRDTQPFNVEDPKLHPLHLLHYLDIESKHRTIGRMGITNLGWTGMFELNRAAEDGEVVVHQFFDIGIELREGAEILRARPVSKNDDLRVVGVVGIEDADIGVGPVSEFNEGGGAMPDLTEFVIGIVDSLAPAID